MSIPRLIFSGLLFVLSFKANADCIDDAAIYHNVNPWILRAIIYIESSSNPSAIHTNTNNTIDIGRTGTNQVHFRDREGTFARSVRVDIYGRMAYAEEN